MDENTTNSNSENSSSQPQNHTSPDPNPITAPSESKKRFAKNKLLLILVVILVIIPSTIAVGVILYQPGPDGNKSMSANTAKTDGQTPNEKSPTPANLLYSRWTNGESQPDGCLPTKTSYYSMSVSGGDEKQITGISENSQMNHYGTYKNHAFITTSPRCNSSDTTSVWYSSDSGQTFSNIYSDEKLDEDWGAITSAKFARDGKSILIGYLTGLEGKNIVKEIDLDTKEVKDLFTVDDRGVFIQGYDRQSQKVLYYSGCYNCDGNPFNKLYVYDLAEGSNSVLRDDPGYYGSLTIINNDFTKVLFSKTTNAYLEEDATSVLEEFDISTGASKQLLSTNGHIFSAGYRNDDNTVYYVKDNTVYLINEAGESVASYEAPQKILDILYINKDQLIASFGEYENRTVVNYNFSNKNATNLLGSKLSETLLGVTEKQAN